MLKDVRAGHDVLGVRLLWASWSFCIPLSQGSRRGLSSGLHTLSQAPAQGYSRMGPRENLISAHTEITRVHAHHALLPIIDVSLAQGKQRNIAAGTPKNDEDLVPDKYLNDLPSPNPNTQQPTATAAIDAGAHGGRGLSTNTECFVLLLGLAGSMARQVKSTSSEEVMS
ncbi:hypothetical protein K503DRAFT_868121 [Rhizopogon vinicolor AM-OR11-026]|uniref:Uncharacterized protein n=1 Tax=Rhizopogon vinicolor AM-OR11-026 TaxID=1314800 RepID=A0A1B7MSQ3_9AGAM|nr:hypothetical protein K503DRAFT_868121 [Rhizopogon vinicolor AM-OR11-026]